jgi:hypothetical protein
MINNRILSVVFAATLFGCSPGEKAQSSPEEEARFKHLAIGALAIREAMRDPESLVIDSAMFMTETKAGCYEYRARNGFGGMNRGKAVLTEKAFKTNDMSGFSSLWNKNCAKRSGEEKGRLMKYVLEQAR